MTQGQLLINFSTLFNLAIPQEAAVSFLQCRSSDIQQRHLQSGLKGMAHTSAETRACVFLSWNCLQIKTSGHV